MTAPNFFLAYASSASSPFSPDALVELLLQSRERNTRASLTGMLLYRGGNFLQCLEGPEVSVRETMLRISRDRRHRSIVPLYDGFHADRLFGEWSMGFEDVTGRDASQLAGLNDYLSRPDDVESGAVRTDHEVFEFFRAFRDYMK